RARLVVGEGDTEGWTHGGYLQHVAAGEGTMARTATDVVRREPQAGVVRSSDERRGKGEYNEWQKGGQAKSTEIPGQGLAHRYQAALVVRGGSREASRVDSFRLPRRACAPSTA